MPVKPIPDGYHGVTLYLIVDGAAEAIAFYETVFGAAEVYRTARPDGKVGHAEVKIGDSPVMIAEALPELGTKSPRDFGGSPVHMMIYVEACDAVFERAVAAGATVSLPLKDQFYGDRSGTFTDPFGHRWTVATRKEDLSPEEFQKRSEAMAEPK